MKKLKILEFELLGVTPPILIKQPIIALPQMVLYAVAIEDASYGIMKKMPVSLLLGLQIRTHDLAPY